MRPLGLIAAFLLISSVSALGQPAPSATQVIFDSLPDSPGATLLAADTPAAGYSSSVPDTWQQLTVDQAYLPTDALSGGTSSATTCTLSSEGAATESDLPAHLAASRSSCLMVQNPFRPYVTPPSRPLTSLGKLHLAVYDLTNPGNLAAVAGNAVYTFATDSHGPYGPGFNGIRRNVQVSLTGEASFELIGTFGVCSLVHQDPRYFRMPNASPVRRLIHAVAHVVIAQSDSGRPMLNIENLVTSYATAELANLYVPGINTNMASTNERILTGLATEPIGNIIAEFLPDLASHVHVHFLIMQRFLNQISTGQLGN